MVQHLSTNNLLVPVQSAYRAHHSTETALLRVMNDLLLAVEDGDAVMLTLLDFSSAFDTIDHSILLHRLEHTFGIKAVALQWFTSYITGRRQAVSIAGVTSAFILLLFGVAQGSVLGPLIFVLYSSPLYRIALLFFLLSHFFSDEFVSSKSGCHH